MNPYTDGEKKTPTVSFAINGREEGGVQEWGKKRKDY